MDDAAEPSIDRDTALQYIAEAVDRVNRAVLYAVNSGVSVEIVRTSRHHDGCGNWGDQMAHEIIDKQEN